MANFTLLCGTNTFIQRTKNSREELWFRDTKKTFTYFFILYFCFIHFVGDI